MPENRAIQIIEKVDKETHHLNFNTRLVTCNRFLKETTDTVFGYIAFLKMVHATLNSIKTSPQIQAASLELSAMFSRLPVYIPVIHGSLTIDETVTAFQLISSILDSRHLKSNLPVVERIKLLAHGFLHSIVSVPSDVVSEPFVDFLVSEENVLFSNNIKNLASVLLMLQYRKAFKSQSEQYFESRSNAILYNKKMLFGKYYAEKLHDFLAYDDVAWLKTVKLYDMSDFNKTAADLHDIIFYFINFLVSSIYLYTQFAKNEPLEDDSNCFESIDLSRRDSFDVMFVIKLWLLSVCLYGLFRSADPEKRLKFVSPLLVMQLSDIFSSPALWGKQIVESLSPLAAGEIGSDCILEQDEFYFDTVENDEEQFSECITFISEADMQKKLTDAYKIVKKEFHDTCLEADFLFGNNLRVGVSPHVARIYKQFSGHSEFPGHCAHFFIGNILHFKDYQDELTLQWRGVLAAHGHANLTFADAQTIRQQRNQLLEKLPVKVKTKEHTFQTPAAASSSSMVLFNPPPAASVPSDQDSMKLLHEVTGSIERFYADRSTSSLQSFITDICSVAAIIDRMGVGKVNGKLPIGQSVNIENLARLNNIRAASGKAEGMRELLDGKNEDLNYLLEHRVLIYANHRKVGASTGLT